jgi:alanyl-tRNA synthetase
VRAGGKHNDLENVGYTARHHTFFEMLGNFSFGDYFKEDAIRFAWEFLTQELQLPAERLWVTVYQDDDEAADIWLNTMGVDSNRFSRMGEKDNFWSMGDTGPCGPCSEIFFDHGAAVPGGPPGSPDEDGDRYVEIWNLVFMQYDRQADGTLVDLPRPSVDTGMGLERMAAVLQGVHSNYDIDLFQALIKSAGKLTGTRDLANDSLKVIADHIRAAAFLINDGVLPGKDGRSYVLRRIIRRALRHGYELGVKTRFFNKLVEPLVQQMGAAYPELAQGQAHIEKVLATEEERFQETLSQGMAILDRELAALDGNTFPGEVAFALYDTYGFPVDLTADILRARDIRLDQAGFEAAMDEQRARARAASKFSVGRSDAQVQEATEFCGYTDLDGSGTITAILREGQPVEQLAAGESGEIVLDQTPFYAEGGGQVGDRGVLSAGDAQFVVSDTQSNKAASLHIGRLESGALAVGKAVTAKVDRARRAATALNHTATHLLHAALRNVLGTHVTQQGSLVTPERLRFDFSNMEPVSADALREIEAQVNAQIRANSPVHTEVMDYDAAIEAGAMALFGEKYGDDVRVLRVGDYSTELCGGTHVQRSGDIGLFRIVSETGIASGVRRIEAITGATALNFVTEQEALLGRLGELLKSEPANLEKKLRQIQERSRELEKELKALRLKVASGAGQDMTSDVTDVGGIKVLALRLEDDTDAGSLRDTVDRLKDKLGESVVVLACATQDGKVRLAAGVSKATSSRIKAGELVRDVSAQVGGKGGGRPDFAQAGGTDPGALDQALATVVPWVRAQLSQ